MVVPPKHTPKWSFSVGKPMVVGYHHFRKPPYQQFQGDQLFWWAGLTSSFFFPHLAGIPSVFWDHVMDWGDEPRKKIASLMKARRDSGGVVFRCLGWPPKRWIHGTINVYPQENHKHQHHQMQIKYTKPHGSDLFVLWKPIGSSSLFGRFAKTVWGRWFLEPIFLGGFEVEALYLDVPLEVLVKG